VAALTPASPRRSRWLRRHAPGRPVRGAPPRRLRRSTSGRGRSRICSTPHPMVTMHGLGLKAAAYRWYDRDALRPGNLGIVRAQSVWLPVDRNDGQHGDRGRKHTTRNPPHGAVRHPRPGSTRGPVRCRQDGGATGGGSGASRAARTAALLEGTRGRRGLRPVRARFLAYGLPGAEAPGWICLAAWRRRNNAALGRPPGGPGRGPKPSSRLSTLR
jgi:hypothetical protein